MNNDSLINKVAKDMKAYKETFEQAQKDFDSNISKIKNERHKAILINAMEEAKEGKQVNLKVVFNQLNSK
jgi:hypothetical protein